MNMTFNRETSGCHLSLQLSLTS